MRAGVVDHSGLAMRTLPKVNAGGHCSLTSMSLTCTSRWMRSLACRSIQRSPHSDCATRTSVATSASRMSRTRATTRMTMRLVVMCSPRCRYGPLVGFAPANACSPKKSPVPTHGAHRCLHRHFVPELEALPDALLPEALLAESPLLPEALLPEPPPAEGVAAPVPYAPLCDCLATVVLSCRGEF